MHAKLYEVQQERERQEAEAKRINDELIQLKTYEQNVKNEIKQLIEKRSKINSLKDELESYRDEVKNLEHQNNQLERENQDLEETNERIKREFERIKKENEKLKELSKNWDTVCKYEKMKSQLMELTNSKVRHR